jgi:hypothetical protein
VLNVWVGPSEAPEDAQPITNDRDRGIRFYLPAFCTQGRAPYSGIGVFQMCNEALQKNNSLPKRVRLEVYVLKVNSSSLAGGSTRCCGLPGWALEIEMVKHDS